MSINVAILGSGNMARVHARHLLRSPDVRLCAVCAHTEDGGERWRRDTGATHATVHTDFERMLDAESPDALYVCLPPDAHNGEIARAAAGGLHLYLGRSRLALSHDEPDAQITTVNVFAHGATMTLVQLGVSHNRRFLVAGDRPFFWLGDTAWELFHRLDRQEAEHYFAQRQRQGFTLVQAVALAELDGLGTPNRYGATPFGDNDPDRPNEAYWSYVDELIDMAAGHGLYVGLLPTWGDKVNPKRAGGEAIFDVDNARRYGAWLGRRYRDRTHLVWVLGGDRPAVHEGRDFRPIWRAMAAGIREAVDGPVLMTYHPNGRVSSSLWLHDEPWLDVNMMQSGHGSGHDMPVWEMIERDYRREPPKPVLDGEPNYEDHPVNPWPVWDPASGYYRDDDVRRQLYRSVFAGACGVTYGHHSIWQFWAPERAPVNHPDRPWQEALVRPGAEQVIHLRRLIESRPMLSRVPDQSLLADDAGSGGAHAQATRDEDGSYAFVFVPDGRPIAVAVDTLSGARLNAWWYCPRTGAATAAGMHERHGTLRLTPPEPGTDWVLALDDASAGFGSPGSGTNERKGADKRK